MWTFHLANVPFSFFSNRLWFCSLLIFHFWTAQNTNKETYFLWWLPLKIFLWLFIYCYYAIPSYLVLVFDILTVRKYVFCNWSLYLIVVSDEVKSRGWLHSLSYMWPISWLRSKIDASMKLLNSLHVDSIMSRYLSLESGKFWFPAQVYNHEVLIIKNCFVQDSENTN